MSDAVDEDAELSENGEAAPPAGSRKKKLLLLVGAPVLTLLLIGGGLWFTGIAQKFLGGGADSHAEAPPPPKRAAFFDLPDMLVNLAGSTRKTSFLKMVISIELEDGGDAPRVQAVMPRIIDNFQTYLRELRPEDLKGSAGMYRLREELLTRVNIAAAPVKVADVLFTEMLVQ
jgi:flagellar protein FliL